LAFAAVFLNCCDQRPEVQGQNAPQAPISSSTGLRQIQPAGHRRMIKHLEAIADHDKKHSYFYGHELVQTWVEQLAQLDQDATGISKLKLHRQIGERQLNAGNLRLGIDHLRENHQLLQSSGTAKPAEVNESRFRLAVAYLRLGETENCCLRHHAESCLFPIRGGGLHTKQEGSRKAIEYLLALLEHASPTSDRYLEAIWLLNIAYMTVDAYPGQVPRPYLIAPSRFESEISFPRFTNVALKLNLPTFNMAGGVIIDDFDNDHDLDIFTSTWDPDEQLQFFQNNGDGSFTDQSHVTGLAGICGGLNIVSADYNNDGFLDLYVLRGAWMKKQGRQPNSLVRNNGDGTFTDVTFDVGLGDHHYPTQTAAWADFDNDGDLDLYVGNEASEALEAPCQLFRNNGDGTFTDIATQAGVENNRFAKGVVWADYSGDNYPDLYVSNYGENRLYRNNGDGTFVDVAPQLGVTGPSQSFPVWFWDFNNDGALDIFVASYTGTVRNVAAYHLGLATNHEWAALYKADGHGGFQNIAEQAGLTYPMLPMGCNFGDLNNDGYLDFYLGTGDVAYKNLVPNVMYVNQQGRRFADVTFAGGFGHLQKGHGVALADLDNDGDQDIYEQMGGFFPGDRYTDALYENPGFGNHWIKVKLVGITSNRSAIGARVHVQVKDNGQTRSIYRHVTSGGSFGANPLRLSVGIGQASRIDRLDVYWPMTGKTQCFRDVAIDQMIQIIEGQSRYTQLKLKRVKLGSPN